MAQSAAVSCKALTPVLGREMVLRVLDALAEADQIDKRFLAGPPIVAVEQNPELSVLVNSDRVKWFAPQDTPSTSAWNILQSLPEDIPVLVTG